VNAVEVFEAERERLVAVAYGMLGSAADAEDVVQEAYLRWHGAAHDEVRVPAAFLTTVVTRLALDRLRSAQRQREEYVGPWLPEPIVGDFDPAVRLADAATLSLALLTTLERLNPIERAVFLLRDVWDLEYDEIAAIVDREPANCRQIARRARARVAEPARRFRPTPEEEQALVAAFVEANEAGDLDARRAVLAEDAVLWSDGGGKTRAALRPVHGASNVARFLLGIATKASPTTIALPVRVNGDPGFRIEDADGLVAVAALELGEGAVKAVRIVTNPDKLRHLARAG